MSADPLPKYAAMTMTALHLYTLNSRNGADLALALDKQLVRVYTCVLEF